MEDCRKKYLSNRTVSMYSTNYKSDLDADR